MKRRTRTRLPLLLWLVLSHSAAGADWPQFRGPGGRGVSSDAKIPCADSARSGKPHYASIVLSGERLYAVSRTGGTYVPPTKPVFKVLAHNQLPSDESDFNASPAISNGQLFLRSNRFIYCIAAE